MSSMLFKPCSDSKSLSLSHAVPRLTRVKWEQGTGAPKPNLGHTEALLQIPVGETPVTSPSSFSLSSLLHLYLHFTSTSRDSCWLFNLRLIPGSQFQDQIVDL